MAGAQRSLAALPPAPAVPASPPAPAGKAAEGGPDELARHLGTQLLHRRLALRVDRLSKKPLPGSKKLVKFPRKLAQLPPEQAMVGSARLCCALMLVWLAEGKAQAPTAREKPPWLAAEHE